MPASTSMVQVSSQQELESAVASYIAQGFVVSNRTPESVLMFKKKEFSVLWAVVGLVLCALPLLVYLIVYATQSDRMVEIRIGSAEALQLGSAAHAGDPQMSDDRHYWWDGAEWRRADQEVPPGARRSDDGHYWWDGLEWRPTSGTDAAPDEAPTTLWAPPFVPESAPPTTTAPAAAPGPTDADLDDLVVIKRKPDLPGPESASR
jgi:hypothetical protein